MNSYPTKSEMWEAGIVHAGKFCQANGLPEPTITQTAVKDWPFGTCAYYRMTPDGKGKVVVCVQKTASVGTAAQAWSYPGYVADRTPYGVIAHEIGHHVDYLMGGNKGAYWSDYGVGIRAVSAEPPITSYAPNTAEWFAEMARLFITNPALLKAIRPKTYGLLIMQLKPVETRGWEEVLMGAPARTLQQACKKAGVRISETP